VHALASQVEKLDRGLRDAREEAESLRYEMHWKDKRIEELQAQLYKLMEERPSMVADAEQTRAAAEGLRVKRGSDDDDTASV